MEGVLLLTLICLQQLQTPLALLENFCRGCKMEWKQKSICSNSSKLELPYF